MLEKDVESETSNYLQGNISHENVATYYKFAETFKLESLANSTSLYIQRCFEIVSETENFLNLDFPLAAKILASSKLSLATELEVFNGVHAWINHNIEERSKHARDMLLKVRLPSLSDDALKYIKASSLTKIKDCSELMDDVLKRNGNAYRTKSPVYFTNRSKNMFNVLLCYGYRYDLIGPGGLRQEEWTEDSELKFQIVSTDVHQLDGTNLNRSKIIASMPKNRCYLKVAFCKGELYFFCDLNENNRLVCSVEKYSMFTKTSQVLNVVDNDRIHYGICTFMNEIYFIGGDDQTVSFNSCEKFSPKDHKFREIAEMKFERAHPACSVFDGRIVVTGGVDLKTNRDLKSVEAYDSVTGSWLPMPDMVHGRSGHGSAVARNKLFVVGGSGNVAEVFDATSKRFAALKNAHGDVGYYIGCRTFSVGNRIVVVEEGKAVCYDANEEQWSEEPIEAAEDFQYCVSVKIPLFYDVYF